MPRIATPPPWTAALLAAAMASTAAAQTGLPQEMADSDTAGDASVLPADVAAAPDPVPLAGSDRTASAGREATVVTISPEPERTVPRTAVAPEDGPDVVDLAAEEVGLAAILGLPVRGRDGSERGEVLDVTISLATGRAMTLVVGEPGGFLGFGDAEQTERIPMAEIAIDPLGEAVIVASGG